MNKKLWDKRIPTILGIGLVIIGIVFTSTIVKNQTRLATNATITEQPQDIKISNISDSSFTISYKTETSTTGSVSFGKDKNLGATELEDLDKETNKIGNHKIHNFTLKKLEPNTKYYLVIISGQDTFLNNETPFEISTGPKISAIDTQQTSIKGRVILPDGNAPNEGIIYLTAENSQTLSSLLTKDGNFDFQLNSLRSQNLSFYIKLDKYSILKLLAINDTFKSNVLLSYNEMVSVPTITLSHNYDFTINNSPIASKSSSLSGFPLSIKKNTQITSPEILSPKEDQNFSDPKPQFSGTSLPNEKVEIIIHSDEQITTQIIADSNGNWVYKHPNNLSPGAHTITIKTRDSSGILTTIMRSFTVLAAQSQISPAPTNTPTPLPTPLPTPTITQIPTSAPTQSPSITPITIESKGGLEPTGNSLIFPLTVGGIVAIMSGIALFLLL